MNFYTADTHFFHDALLVNQDFSPRNQFIFVDDMNQTIMNNWNNKVKQSDTVYHLGDISHQFTKPPIISMQNTLRILKKLNGNLIIIKGNHDSSEFLKFLIKNNYTLENGRVKFEVHEVGLRLKFDHHEIFLTHYPIIFGKTKNQINLHGHIHDHSVPQKENINVGIDSKDIDQFLNTTNLFGAPLSQNEVIQIIRAKHMTYLKNQ